MLRLSLALALLACASAPAQITVHPNQNLQAAVDAVPDGGWVLIFGGSYPSPLAIENKSVALVGAAPWSIHNEAGYSERSRLWPGSSSYSQQAWCIEARGRREHVLIIHNARLSGTTYGSINNGGGPARIEGYGAVWVADTIANGFDARDFDGRPAVPGITYSAAGGHMLVERCIVTGGIPSSYNSSSIRYSPPGGPGIHAPGSTVQMLIALVQGGPGNQFVIDSDLGAPATWRPTLVPCPCVGYSGGEGGPAIVSGSILDPGLAILEGGRGAAVQLRIYANSGILYVPWGFMPTGPQWVRG